MLRLFKRRPAEAPAPAAKPQPSRTPDRLAQPSPAGLGLLLALNRTGKHIYEGTVPGSVKARRRATNKRARQARAMHRRAAR